MSSESKKTYSALTCSDCGGSMSSTEFIVEADTDCTGLAPTQCQGGRTCTMAFRSQICLRIVTSTIWGRNGRLKVWVNSGGGYVVEKKWLSIGLGVAKSLISATTMFWALKFGANQQLLGRRNLYFKRWRPIVRSNALFHL